MTATTRAASESPVNRDTLAGLAIATFRCVGSKQYWKDWKVALRGLDGEHVGRRKHGVYRCADDREKPDTLDFNATRGAG